MAAHPMGVLWGPALTARGWGRATARGPDPPAVCPA